MVDNFYRASYFCSFTGFGCKTFSKERMIKAVKKNRRRKGKHFKSWLKELRKIYKITHMCSRWKNPFEKSNYKFIQKIPIYVEWVNTKKIERKIRDRRTDGELDQILAGNCSWESSLEDSVYFNFVYTFVNHNFQIIRQARL